MTSYSVRLLAWVDALETQPLKNEEHGVSSYEIDLIVAKHYTPLMRSILKDHEVAAGLDQIGKVKEKSNVANEKVFEEFKRFIVDIAPTCSFFNSTISAVETTTRPNYRSDKIRKMKALVDKSKALSDLIRQLKVECSNWTGTEYLELRHKAGSPHGFSEIRRGFSSRTSSPNTTIYDLLSAFADDTAEQVEMMEMAIKTDRKPGGKTSDDRRLTMSLGASCRRNLGRLYPSLITFIISRPCKIHPSARANWKFRLVEFDRE